MVRIIQNLWFAMHLSFPWVWRTFTGTLWLVITTVASIWSGVPPAARTIAEVWLDRAIRAGFPTIWERQLRFVLRTLAYVTILLGWIILSYITVFIVKWIV